MYKKKIVALIIFNSFFNVAISQSNSFFKYILDSDSLYKNKKYTELIVLFEKGKPYQSKEFKYRMYDYYYQASSHVKLGDTKNAFKYLDILNEKYEYSDTSIISDKNFKILHNDIRWNKFTKSVNNNLNKKLALKNKYINIIHLLDSLHTVDQSEVLQLDENNLRNKSKKEIDSLNKSVYNSTKARGQYLFEITKDMPWLSKYIIGNNAYEMIFLAAQHSSNIEHLEYILKKYRKNRKEVLEYAHYAMIYDRLQTLKKQKQRYGTQIIINNSTSDKFYYIIEDKTRINEYRKYCYYDSLEEDMKWHNMSSLRETTREEQEEIK